jgi:predicted RNase H-like HicB family nuclease
VAHVRVVIEKHPDGYIAYPLCLKGVIVSQGETYDEVLHDMHSAIRFHIETFGHEVFEEAEFWPRTSQVSLDVTWAHLEDNVYGKPLAE